MNMEDNNQINEDANKELSSKSHLIIREAQYTKKLIDQQLAYGTKRVYQSDWRIFEVWCNQRHYQAINATPEVVAMFIGSQFEDGLHPSTLNRRLAAIKFAYSCLNKESPTDNTLVKATLKGIRRDEQAPPVKAKKAAVTYIIKEMIQLCSSNSLRHIRDRAILLLGFAGAFRRSELTAINIEDITFTIKGMDIKIHRSKTDQEKKGDIKIILPAKGDKLFCPVLAVKNWLDNSQIKNGALFRGITKHNKINDKGICDNVVYHLIKRCACELGYNIDDFSPHSLRAGFVTSAYENKAMLSKIMEQAHMKSMQTAQRYIRHAQRYENHAAEDLL
jgi:site-specific recombinase XerD